MAAYLLEHENRHAPVRVDGRRFWGHSSRRSPITYIGVHTPETALDLTPPDTSAEAVARYFATTKRPASAHVNADSDSVVRLLPDHYTAFHVRDFNSSGLGIEISSRHDQWRSAPADHIHRTLVTASVPVAQWCDDYEIPTRRITRAQVTAGVKGLAAHSDLDPARRRDPGEDFPWEPFLGLVAQRIGGGSMPDVREIGAPVVGPPLTIAGTPGYAQVDSLGGVHCFGGFPDHGSVPRLVQDGAIPGFPPGHCTGAASDHDGEGYLVHFSSGHLYAFRADFAGRVEARAA